MKDHIVVTQGKFIHAYGPYSKAEAARVKRNLRQRYSQSQLKIHILKMLQGDDPTPEGRGGLVL